MNFFDVLDRHTFAIFCVYCAEFTAAQQDILDNGYSRNVRTVSGDLMPRLNPSVDRRDNAQKIILEMAKRFGLTALDYLSLTGRQASVNLPVGGLFGPPPRPAGETPGASATQPAVCDVVGIVNQFDSLPPNRIQ
ncbi:P27 family phage terminase small subunit [Methylocella silvestris]|uniref:P27 family phage terminase small subunit n=1 Tax=Methylocella silvestris TaxID=199596 RepID=UPI001FE1871B|nr:P27 family phage terminase small subunit [Methylocella silvestris]